MVEKEIALTIEKLAGLGDGVGHSEGRRVFVPYTLPGDVVRARITHVTKDAVSAMPEEILMPGPERIAPICRHFADCGGCALQHLRETSYRDFKWQMARQAVRKAGFDPDCVSPLERMPTNSRRRVELKAQGGKLGYYAERSHRLVDILECKVLEPGLEALVMRLKPQLSAMAAISSMQINGVDNGYDVLLHGSAPPTSLLHDDTIVRICLQTDSDMSVLHQSRPVTVTFAGVGVEPPPGAFLQAVLQAQDVMTQFVLEAAQGANRVLDLFSGIGTYSFPLARQGAEIMAVEGERDMVKAIQGAAQRHGLKNVKALARDLFRQPFLPSQMAGYDLVVINPPRAGAKEQVAALAVAKVKKLVMISCNPATFSRDARQLKDAGYHLVHARPIDQFIYSSHLEILAEFSV